MISECLRDNVSDIAEAQVSAWKVAFQGILSERVLSSLDVRSFESNWQHILTLKERKNSFGLIRSPKVLVLFLLANPKTKMSLQISKSTVYMYILTIGVGVSVSHLCKPQYFKSVQSIQMLALHCGRCQKILEAVNSIKNMASMKVVNAEPLKETKILLKKFNT